MFNLLNQLWQIGLSLITFSFYTLYVSIGKPLRWLFPRSLKSLDGEVILITGTGNGIGRQLAVQLATVAPNSKLVCWDIDVHGNEMTIAAIRKNHTRLLAQTYVYQVDIANREAVERAAEKVRREVGQVTVVINNAGVCSSGPFLLQTPESLEKTFSVNVLAHFWILREFLPHMIRTNHGHIVTMASIMSGVSMKDFACYSASKHAIHGFIDSLKQELLTHPGGKLDGINFTNVYPIWVQTPLIENVGVRPKFPLIFPSVVTPEYVAQRTIDGFRRNQEYLYLPMIVKDLIVARNLLPFAVQHKAFTGLLDCEFQHSHLDPKAIRAYQDLVHCESEKEKSSVYIV